MFTCSQVSEAFHPPETAVRSYLKTTARVKILENAGFMISCIRLETEVLDPRCCTLQQKAIDITCLCVVSGKFMRACRF